MDSKYYSDKILKPVPQATDLEQEVLGVALLERQGQLVVLEKLTPDDFYLPAHQDIFTAIVEVANAGMSVDIKSVVHQLRKTGKLEVVGGAYAVNDLMQKVRSSANIEQYCLVLIEKRILRDMIQLSMRIQQKAYDDDADPFKLLDEVSAFPVQVIDKIKSGSERHIKEGIIELAQDINTRTVDKPIDGLPTGFQSIDKILRGLKGSNFVIVASRPGMGKTTLAMNMARNMAVTFKAPVGVFELEMSFKELARKLASMESDIEQRRLLQEVLTPTEVARFMQTAGNALALSPIWIDDTPAISIMELRTRARRMKEKYGVKAIIIDYVQLMRGEVHARKNRENEIASISRGCKLIAKELDIPVIALAQLSRDIEKRPASQREPMLSDLRESGALEQDADIVIFLLRPGYYKISGDDGGTYMPGLTKVIVAKHRNGETGEACLQMLGHTSRFRDLDGPYTTQQVPEEIANTPNDSPKPQSNGNTEELPF